MYDHITLRVGDFTASLAFYRARRADRARLETRAHERFRAEHENDTLIVDARFKLVEGQPLDCPSVLSVAPG